MAKAKSKALAVEDDEILFEIAAKDTRSLSAEERVKRNLKIAADRAAGVSAPELALEWGISTRAIHEIAAKYRKLNPTLRNHDPVQIVDEMLEGYAADLSSLVKIQEKAMTDKHYNAAIGAVNSKTAIRGRMAELLQAINALPHDLGMLRVVMDGRVLSERLLAVLARHGLDTDEVLTDLAELLPPPPVEDEYEEDEIVDAEVVTAS